MPYDRRSRIGQSFEFGGNLGCPGRADPLEDLQRVPQHIFCLDGVAGGESALAQAGQRVGLTPPAADLPGQVQRLLVA